MPFYAKVLEGIDPGEEFDILEIGVLNSKSIVQWRQSFPKANITGCDINTNPNWYRDARVSYLQFDQSDASSLGKAVQALKDPRIIIDDGSHIPFHQLIFLHIATSAVSRLALTHKRVVIIEDLHTALEQALADKSKQKMATAVAQPTRSRPLGGSPYQHLSEVINPMGLLLALEKVQSGSQTQAELLHQVSQKISAPELQTILEEIITNSLKATRISIYKRTTLPSLCWRCGSNLFDLQTLTCQGCGEDGYKHADSITACLEYIPHSAPDH